MVSILAEKTTIETGDTRPFLDVPLQMALGSALEAMLKDPKVSGTECYLLNEQTGCLTYACHRGLSEACAQEAPSTIRVGEGIEGTVVATGEPFLVADIHKAAGFARNVPKREGYSSLYSTPIRSSEGVCGVLNLYFRDNQLFPRYLNWLDLSAGFLRMAYD